MFHAQHRSHKRSFCEYNEGTHTRGVLVVPDGKYRSPSRWVFGGHMRFRIAALFLILATAAMAGGPPPIPIIVENIQ